MSVSSCTLLVDVGGTHIRFATLAGTTLAGTVLSGTTAAIQDVRQLRCADFETLEQAIASYLQAIRGSASPALNLLCLAIPGAVHLDPVPLINNPWLVSRQQLELQFHCPVQLINDFSAQALAIPAFAAQELHWLRQPATNKTLATRAIIGPGTGLGVAGLLANGSVLESEAGHLGFAPGNAEQQQLLSVLWQKYPRLSVERLLSGPGLENLYWAMQQLDGRDATLTAEHIARQAQAGDAMCLKVIAEFTRIFGSVCGDIALAFFATSGVYLSGGVLKNLGTLFDERLFLQHFVNKGRYEAYCQSIPIALVRCEHPGLLGAACHANSLHAAQA